MVTCDLVGRLGNQMFQIATTYAYAKRTAQDWVIPPQSLSPQIWPSYFNFGPHTKKYIPLHIYHEPGHEFREIPFIKDVRLHGYFQSEKYFKEYRQEIIYLFSLPNIKSEVVHKIPTVAVHVRRGDYLQFQDKHPVITEEYLISAISKFISEGYDNFAFFSDDIDWCVNFCKHHGIHAAVSYEQDAIRALVVMSRCHSQICSNSSFSWWAAWLNPNPNKIVIMPKIWFGPGNAHLETKDIYPENAIVI